MNAPNENVLVIRRSLLDQLGNFHGLNFEPEKYLAALLSRGNNFFFPRVQAENDPTYKQIIPYVLLAFEDKVLCYVRGKKAGEQRLVAKGSIGIGGDTNGTVGNPFRLGVEAYLYGALAGVDEDNK